MSQTNQAEDMPYPICGQKRWTYMERAILATLLTAYLIALYNLIIAISTDHIVEISTIACGVTFSLRRYFEQAIITTFASHPRKLHCE